MAAMVYLAPCLIYSEILVENSRL